MSGLVNKVKEAVHSDKQSELPEGTYGTHNSRAANAADPRIDSDRDNRAAGVGHTGHNTHTGHSTHAGHNTHTGAAGAGIGAGGANVTGYNDPQGVHGPHSSRLANTTDPRVDSDRDHRGAATHGTTGFGTTGTTGTTGTIGTAGTAGAAGYGSATGASNVTGYNDPVGTHGTHNSRLANTADPRIDSDRDHRGAPGAAGTAHIGSGPGPAPNTAGPHKSDLLNKADPRVDSDLDGSKTVGGNKTLSSGTTTVRDPTDAAQAPPSVLRQHVGGPSIEHGDLGHGRSERHTSVSHQEAHRGL